MTNSAYRNKSEGKSFKNIAEKDGRCMGMQPDRPKTSRESFGQWVMSGKRCRLKARPFFCPIHLHVIQEQLGCCTPIDEELIKKVISKLPEDDEWLEADVSEIMLRANGQKKPKNVYLPTETDRTTLCKGG